MQRRDIAQALVASAAGIATLPGASNAQGAARNGYPQTAAEASKNVVPANDAYAVGDLRRYGGDPSGTLDSSDALHAAVALGVVLIPAGCTFRILTGATCTGPISVLGAGPTSQLLCDGLLLTVNSGSGSVIDNFQMLNITAPWIISRNPSSWGANVAGTLRRSNDDGYQPTSADFDVWPVLTEEQKKQQIGPAILFRGNASHISVSRVCGRFVAIYMYDTQFSSVCDCDIRGGKGATAAITFWNVNDQVGQFNKALRNTVSFSSFSGIAFARNYDFQAQNNYCVYGGESGIKTWQGNLAGKDARCYRGQIQNNSCKFNYFDGIDAMADASPADDSHLTCHQVQDNTCHGNGGDGINCSGQFNLIAANYLSLNGRFGLWGSGLSLSKISGNICIDNNQTRNVSQHDLCIVGEKSNNVISDNYVWAGAGQNNYGIYAPGSNFVSGNEAVNDARFFFGHIK